MTSPRFRLSFPFLSLQTWPVAFAIGAGLVLCGYYVGRTLFFHSDVQVSKNVRIIDGINSFDHHRNSDGTRKSNVLRHFKDGEEVIPQFRTLSGQQFERH